MASNSATQLRKVEAILFDLDGTLLDRAASLREFASWQSRELFGTDRPHDKFVTRFIELDANGSVWKDEVYKSLIEEFSIENIPVDDLLETYLGNFCKFCQAAPFAIDAIADIKQLGLKVGLVSNGKSPIQEMSFAALGIADFFDDVIVSDAVGYKKPDRKIFELACRRLKVKPENAVFIGDNPIADIQGASNAGMYTIYIPGVFGDSCRHADKICGNLKDLAGLITSGF